MSEVRIAAETRTATGTSGARATRRAGKVPGVLYGHGEDVVLVALDARELTHALRHGRVLFEVELEGKRVLALPKQVQRHPLRDVIEHIDLLIVRRGERVTVDIHVVLAGIPVAGGVVNQSGNTVSVEVEATQIPDSVELDVTGLDVGEMRTAGDVTLPEGAVLLTDPDEVLLSILAPAVEEPTEAEVEAAPAGEATGGEETG